MSFFYFYGLGVIALALLLADAVMFPPGGDP